MDHLRITTNSVQSIEVPYYAEIEFDGGSFEGYPERRNFTSGNIRWGVWKDEEKAAAFMQEWLFFGLMTVVFGIKVSMEDFLLITKQGKRVTTTKTLPRYIQEWLTRCETMPKELLEKYSDLINKTILHASHHNLNIKKIPSLIPVNLSISMLVQNLTDASSFLGFYMNDFETQGKALVIKGQNWLHIDEPFLEQQMLEDGWCPREVARIRSKDLPCTTVHYLSSLKRRFQRVDHKLCSESQCMMDTIPEEAYETKHVTEACSCDHIALPMRKLRAIISDGNIPIVSCTLGSSGQLDEFEVLIWNPDLEFVALSHIWSDGLGNPSGNTLPECQILNICEMVTSICSGGEKSPNLMLRNEENARPPSPDTNISPPHIKCLFWIDSLCIPTGESFSHLRKKAILRMREIYANAHSVLALDAELVKLSGLNSVEENLARTFCSLWMRRCWPLQELSSSRKCYVKFSDTFFDLTDNMKLRKDRWPATLVTDYDFDSTFYYLSKQFTEIFESPGNPSHNESEKMAERFAHTWNTLTWRSTAREEDRYAVLAMLLDSNLEKVLSTKDIEERIRIILTSQKFIPMSIFTLRCRRQRTLGFNWAPAEFSPTALDMRTPEWHGVGFFDGTTLNVSCRGMILHAAVKYAEFYLFKNPSTNRWCLIQHQFSKDDPANEDMIKDSNNHTACFIFDNGPSAGARLSLLGKMDNNVLVVRYDCMVALLELPPESIPRDIDNLDARKTPGVGIGFAETYIPLVHAEAIRSDQQWRIC